VKKGKPDEGKETDTCTGCCVEEIAEPIAPCRACHGYMVERLDRLEQAIRHLNKLANRDEP
jgi:hypothetical protein